MPELFLDFLQPLFDEFANPQKRIFVGYLASAVLLALFWLCIVEKVSTKAAIAKIFDKDVWLSTSSLADFKIMLANRLIMSGTAAAIVSQITISTFLYKLLHGQNLIEPLALHFTSAGSVAVLFTVFFFVIDDFSWKNHQLRKKIP